MGCTDIHCNRLMHSGDGEAGCGGGMELRCERRERRRRRGVTRAELEKRKKKANVCLMEILGQFS